MARNPYRHHDRLRESVVDATENGQSDQLLADLHGTLQKALAHLKPIDVAPADDLHATHAFTDNVVLGIPLVDQATRGEDEIGNAFTSLPGYQLEMALGGFFVRGGLTVDAHYMHNDVVFGPGLVDAIGLEKKADVPRIILGPRARRYVLRQLDFYARVTEAPHNTVILVDSDGRWFVNYLSETGPLWGLLPDAGPLKIHADRISASLRDDTLSARARYKYEWLAGYHNWFCDQYGVGEPYRVPVELVPQESGAWHPKRLSQVLIEVPIKPWNRLSSRQRRAYGQLPFSFLSTQ